jgi:hypothetical protein
MSEIKSADLDLESVDHDMETAGYDGEAVGLAAATAGHNVQFARRVVHAAMSDIEAAGFDG